MKKCLVLEVYKHVGTKHYTFSLYLFGWLIAKWEYDHITNKLV